MKYFTADQIYTNTRAPISGKVIVTDDDGTIIDIVKSDSVSADVLHITGAIVPGFVNAHCHLELSHLKDRLATGTGLIPFIKSVVTQRDFPKEVIQEATYTADEEMYNNGIVAVGDISNQLDTAACKSKSLINYYTFVEMFDLLQEDQAETLFRQYLEVYDGQSDSNGNKKSCVPHAPYTVSKRLFRLINDQNTAAKTVSLHNQETWHENEFFTNRKGGLIEFFESFGIDINEFKATGKTSIHYALDNMHPSQKTLFIHNTMSTEEDITAAHDWNQNCYWVTCPNANLFIENKLPDYRKFMNQNAKMAIGTDSLSSNWQLSIFEELKTIQKYQSYLDSETLVKWSSYYGAEALGYDELGSIEKGKKPGLVALEGNFGNGNLVFELVERYYRLI